MAICSSALALGYCFRTAHCLLPHNQDERALAAGHQRDMSCRQCSASLSSTDLQIWVWRRRILSCLTRGWTHHMALCSPQPPLAFEWASEDLQAPAAATCAFSINARPVTPTRACSGLVMMIPALATGRKNVSRLAPIQMVLPVHAALGVLTGVKMLLAVFIARLPRLPTIKVFLKSFTPSLLYLYPTFVQATITNQEMLDCLALWPCFNLVKFLGGLEDPAVR
ncbi:hypothetical protein DFH08DRAFT_956805 [Mycena albidolilacea]|uniref:Uncharacterized protein n=1 Tax=Mycena albidolilacea TaxID=1033008 RepID=A0AAD7ETZ8_9AGAR|nr:hypothetical protein DFH08DRAFT_956805 [Mycena albidolilacea]